MVSRHLGEILFVFLIVVRARKNENSNENIQLPANLGELAFGHKRAFSVPYFKAKTVAPKI